MKDGTGVSSFFDTIGHRTSYRSNSAAFKSPKVSPFFAPILKIGPIFAKTGKNWEKSGIANTQKNLDITAFLNIPKNFPNFLIQIILCRVTTTLSVFFDKNDKKVEPLPLITHYRKIHKIIPIRILKHILTHTAAILPDPVRIKHK